MSIFNKIKIFIGSGEASILERKTLIYSLRKNTNKDLDIYVFNGTHNSIELNKDEPVLAPMNLRIKYKNFTEFSLYRYLIPQICQYKGKAIYLDSDMICLDDIEELFNTSIESHDFLAKKNAYSDPKENLWGPSVMLINCSTFKPNLNQIFDDIENGLYSVMDFTRFSPLFLKFYPYKIGELDPNWNVFDSYNQQTKLIHYTDLNTQPWKYPNHPYGSLWFKYFNEAFKFGYITEYDIYASIQRGYVRKDIIYGNSTGEIFLNKFKAGLKKYLSRYPAIKSLAKKTKKY